MTGFGGGRVRRWLAVLGTAALVGAVGPVVVGLSSAGAAACTPSTLADDGSATSLRGLLEDLGSNGCDPVQLAAGATYDLTDGAGDIDIDAAVTIEGNGATIRQTVGDERVLQTNFDLTLRNVTITGGHAFDDDGGGVESYDGNGETLRIVNSTIIGNSADFDGGGIKSHGPLVVINSTIRDNSAGDDGAGFDAADTASVTASTISGNCANDDGGAIDSDGDLSLVNSTVTNNTADDQGAIAMDSADLRLVYSDVVANIADDDPGCPNVVGPNGLEANEVEPLDTGVPSNISFEDGSGTLRSFGSVVAQPLIDPSEGGTPFNCDTADPTQSSGYNFSDDQSCGFTNAATGDRESAGNPGLGGLTNNGGPTRTFLPQAGSPLLNFIPLTSCSGGDTLAGFAVTNDQRGIVRPQATGCEIGSVEVEAVAVAAPAAAPQAVLILPRFTG